MRFSVNLDCTPEEARRFLGLPDVAPMQDALMEQMQKQMEANLQAFGAGNPFRPWLELNMQVFNQFRQLCLTAAESAASAPATYSLSEKKRA